MGALSGNCVSGSISRDKWCILASLRPWKKNKKSMGQSNELLDVIYSNSFGHLKRSMSPTEALDKGTMPSGLVTPMRVPLNSNPLSNLSTGSRIFHSCNSDLSSKLNWKEKLCSSGGRDATTARKAGMSAFSSGPLDHLL